MGAILFTGCDLGGRSFTKVNHRGYQDLPRITLGWGATEKSGTGDAFKVRLPFYPPYGGVTTYAEYTGGFSYDVDNKKITLPDNCGPFKRGDRVSCVYYSDFYDSLFIDGTRFG
jgi:hypothetical protein